MILLMLSGAALMGCSPQAESNESQAGIASQASVETSVITGETAEIIPEEWGVFRKYFEGDTRGLSEVLSGTATIKPGMEIHPPHKHAEEEFLMVLEGSGEWTIGEESFPANAGDMLYASAWDLHGIKNTGDTELTFVFWKGHPKGMPVPVDPAS